MSLTTAASRRTLALSVLLIALGLGGCASLRPAAPAPAATEVTASADARQLPAWSLAGKAGIRFLGQNISATYKWRRTGDNYDAEAAGPLNQGHTTLSSRNGQVVLENAWLGRHESDDAEGLAEALTSVRIPLTSLNAWLMGWPADAATPVTALAEPEGVREFSERGWTTRVAGEQVVAGYRLPTRLVMTRDHDRIVLTLASWQPGTAGDPPASGTAPATKP